MTEPSQTTTTVTIAQAFAATLKPNALAVAALAILRSLPSGSGVCPIGEGKMYPPRDNVTVPTASGGYAPYYDVFPVPDASGLFLWNGLRGVYPLDGQTQAQVLARSVLTANTSALDAGAAIDDLDVSWSADFCPGDKAQSEEPYPPIAETLTSGNVRPQPASTTGVLIGDPRRDVPPLVTSGPTGAASISNGTAVAALQGTTAPATAGGPTSAALGTQAPPPVLTTLAVGATSILPTVATPLHVGILAHWRAEASALVGAAKRDAHVAIDDVHRLVAKIEQIFAAGRAAL